MKIWKQNQNTLNQQLNSILVRIKQNEELFRSI